MSQSSFQPHHATLTQASTSTHPHQAISASYHPLPRPRPIPALEPVDTQAVKQELHDALGENGLPYWKAMNGYLLGQVGKVELEGMVRSWLPKERIHLHNKLLFSILRNASASRQPPASAALAAQKKRKRVPPDHPEFDVDEVTIEGKARVQLWNCALQTKDRNRMKRLMAGRGPQAVSAGANGTAAQTPAGEEGAKDGASVDAGQDWLAQQKKSSAFTPRTFFAPPLSSDRSLPSASQLSDRLASLAPSYGLTVSAEAAGEIGEFLAVGMDAHMVDILHGVVHLTGTDRAGGDGIHIPAGISAINEESEEEADEGLNGKEAGPEPVGLFAKLPAKVNGAIGPKARKSSDVNMEHHDPGKERDTAQWDENGIGEKDQKEKDKVNDKEEKKEKDGMEVDEPVTINGKRKRDSIANGAPSQSGSPKEGTARKTSNGDTEAKSGDKADINGDVDMSAINSPTDGPIKPLFQSPEAIKTSLPKWGSDLPAPNRAPSGTSKPRLPAQPTANGTAEPKAKKRKSTQSAPEPPSPKLKPTVDTLQHLFAIAPGLHAQTSPALYKLAASQYQAEIMGRRGVPTSASAEQAGGKLDEIHGHVRPRSDRLAASRQQSALTNGTGPSDGDIAKAQASNGITSGPSVTRNGLGINGIGMGMGTGVNGLALTTSGSAAASTASKSDTIASLQHLSGPNRLEQMSKALLASNLLQPEKQPEEGKKKHSHHWKYEDPAIMLKDVLG